MAGRLAPRLILNHLATAACGAMVLVALVPLLSLLWLVISKGVGGLSFAFFVSRPAPMGEAGGVGPAIVGTFFMVGMACLVALPLGVGAGVYLAERGSRPFPRIVRFLTEVLSGVPSIVLGVVAYALLVVPMKRFSAIAGAFALSLVMVPPLARSTEEFVRLVPLTLREASLALGVPAWRTSLKVVLRTALGGIATAALLAVARGAGETAPLLFTVVNNQFWQGVAMDAQMANLPVVIFQFAMSPDHNWQRLAWGGALVITFAILILNISARLLANLRGFSK